MQADLQKFLQICARVNRGRKRPRYSEALKYEAVRLLRVLQRDGVSQRDAAMKLRLNLHTLQAWSRTHASEAMAAVDVVPESASYVVHGPNGMRVELPSAEAVASLWRALSCS